MMDSFGRVALALAALSASLAPPHALYIRPGDMAPASGNAFNGSVVAGALQCLKGLNDQAKYTD